MGFGAIELTTRTVSWLLGKGFTLSLHELEPYAKKVENLYQWHPFTGMTFTPNNVFQRGHPYQKERSLIVVDNHGFLSNVPPTLEYQKSPNEIRIATIGASTTASINLSYDENWPGHLGTLLQNALPAKKIRVINAGVPDLTLPKALEIWLYVSYHLAQML